MHLSRKYVIANQPAFLVWQSAFPTMRSIVSAAGRLRFPYNILFVPLPQDHFYHYMNPMGDTCIDSSEVRRVKGKRVWTLVGVVLGMLVLILDGRTALEGAREGIELCLKTVIPSLFPFFVLSILLTSSLTGSRSPVLRPLGRLFGIPDGGESLLIPAFLGGYPVGAQCVAAAYRSGHLEKDTAQRMLAFCSNAGPAFLFGMVSPLFPRRWMAWVLWGIHIGGALCAAALIPAPSGSAAPVPGAKPATLTGALNDSLRVMATVCGWVTLFRVLLAFLNRWFLWLLPTAAQVAVTGILELSNGCCALAAVSDVPVRFVICAGILSLGGLCVTMQTLSVTRGLSLRLYFSGKIIQTLFSLAAALAAAYGQCLPLALIFLFFLILKLQKKSSIPSVSGV